MVLGFTAGNSSFMLFSIYRILTGASSPKLYRTIRESVWYNILYSYIIPDIKAEQKENRFSLSQTWFPRRMTHFYDQCEFRLRGARRQSMPHLTLRTPRGLNGKVRPGFFLPILSSSTQRYSSEQTKILRSWFSTPNTANTLHNKSSPHLNSEPLHVTPNFSG